ELPDKTALAILLMATRKQGLPVFIGVALAFVTQSLVAVLFGSALSHLPVQWVRVGSGILFVVFAFVMWPRGGKPEEEEKQSGKKVSGNFLQTAWTSFVVIFLAEWGDLTQLSTIALVARYQHPFLIFVASTLAL